MPVALYRPRRPRASPLWQCIEDHREAFERHYVARFQKRDGYFRPEVSQTLDAFETCGDLSRGFARLHCDHCGHDYLIAFSCKQRYFCPSCHQKKVQQFGEFVRHEVVRKVPHRQIVVTIPKRLRKAFHYDRNLLTDFCQAAWLSLRDVIRTRLGTPNGQPGVIVAIQTFGDYLNFHPHLHILITDGAFVGHHTFHTLPRTDWDRVADLLQARVLKFFVRKDKLSTREAQKMRQWVHSGFNIHAGHRIQRDDHDGLENLAQYILRNPFSLEKMTYIAETGEVIYRSKRNHATNRLWETFDGPAFIAAITRHIPPPGQHLVRYYGAYSNRARGERRKQAANAPIPSAANTSLPIRRSYADFAQEQDQAGNQQRAQAFDQELPLDPHPDACMPTVPSQPTDSIEVIELSPHAFPRIPRKKWRELIQKVWETDPFICPQCARLMCINGLLEDREAAAALLNSLGWLGYATDSRGARAPPPPNDPNVPELPFTCEFDGVVYEPEPWELARQQRLERYAQQRVQIAGIVVYDGEWNETASTQVTGDLWPQATVETQTEFFPDEFDQRLPDKWQQCPWQQTAEQWQETPLAQRATEANAWDGIDPVPPEEEPVFFTD